MPAFLTAAAAILLFLAAPATRAEADATPAPFSGAGLRGWLEQTFSGRAPVVYRLVEDGGMNVLEADCAAAASGRLWRAEIDLARTPMLAWRWKVESLPRGAAERTRPGDDFAARVYVVASTGFTPLGLRSLVYVWAREAAVGTDWPNPYTSRAHHVALRAGAGELGRWRDEQRDVRADFRRYFDLDVERADSVALMTDCDDTASVARARYGDIRLLPRAP